MTYYLKYTKKLHQSLEEQGYGINGTGGATIAIYLRDCTVHAIEIFRSKPTAFLDPPHYSTPRRLCNESLLILLGILS